MKRNIKLLLLGIVLSIVFLLLSLSAVAQEEPDIFTFPNSSATVQYPGDWNVLLNDDGSVSLSGEALSLTLYDSTYLMEIEGIDEESTPLDVLAGAAALLLAEQDIEFNEEIIEEIESNGRAAARYDYVNEEYGRAGVFIAVEMSDGSLGLVNISSPPDEFEDAEETALAVIASFDVGGFSLNIDIPDDIFCTVSTDQTDTVRVRVGPGTNRSAIIFLSANREFAVMGQAEASDGSLWWKLDKEEVAPNKMAAEVWVAQDEVESTGLCEDVADVAAPPIIPIVVPPPAGEGEDVAEGILPTPGMWTMRVGIAQFSCPGTGTVTFDSQMSPQSIMVSIEQDGAVLIIGIDRLNRTAPGFYEGQSSVPIEGQILTAQVTLQVTAENNMDGVLTMSVEGCSLIVPITITR